MGKNTARSEEIVIDGNMPSKSVRNHSPWEAAEHASDGEYTDSDGV